MHVTGLKVLSQTERVDDAKDISGQEMEKVLIYLCRHYDFIVIDGIRDFGERAIVALDMSSYVVLNVPQEALAFRNAKRCLKLFRMLGYGDDKVRVVLNRYQPSRHIDKETISTALGRAVDGTVRNNYPSIITSINEGRLLVSEQSSTKVAKDIKRLCPLFFKRPSSHPA